MSLIDKRVKIECPINIKDTYEILKSVCYNIKGMYVLSYSDTNFTLLLETPATMWSWGENINICCQYLNNGHTQIQITSSPQVPTTLIDFGKGKRNLKKIVTALQPVLPSMQIIK